MKRRTVTITTQLIAVWMSLTMARFSFAAPKDIIDSPAPAMGAEPPKGVEIKSGDASVSPQTGAFTYSYPIALPPGRRGIAPSLALSYSSQAPLYGGIAAGWSMSLPVIKRDWSRGHVAEETWVSSMAGGRELVQVDEAVPSGDWSAFRAQSDSSYARYQRQNDRVAGEPYWTVLTTDGLKHEFGGNGNDEVSDVWPISKTIDAFGNEVRYVWKNHWGGIYGANNWFELRLEKILYTYNEDAHLAAHAEIVFNYAQPSTQGCPEFSKMGEAIGGKLDYDTGRARMQGAFAIESIDIKSVTKTSSVPVLTRRVELEYDDAAMRCNPNHAPLRLLTAIRELDPDGTLLLPPPTFDYGSLGHDVSEPVDFNWPGAQPEKLVGWGTRNLEGPYKGIATLQAQMIDLNADSRPDRARVDADGQACFIRAWTNGANSTFDVRFLDDPSISTRVPPVPWSAPDTTMMGDGESCSLTGQLSLYTNKDPPPPGTQCHGRPPIGNINAYRLLDIDNDGDPDLVTALHYDSRYYEASPDTSDLGQPAIDAAEVACPVLDGGCVSDAVTCWFENGDDPENEVCEWDHTALQACVESAPRVGCHTAELYAQKSPMPKDWNLDIQNPGGDPVPPKEDCQLVRTPETVDGEYLWHIYWNDGSGNFDINNRKSVLSQIPLDSVAGDPVSQSPRGVASSAKSIIDLDGDGYLDLVMVAPNPGEDVVGGDQCTFDRQDPQSNCEPGYVCRGNGQDADEGDDPDYYCFREQEFWLWWRGDGTGEFHGEESSDWFRNARAWPAPIRARPSSSSQDTSGALDQTLQTQTLADFNGDGRVDLLMPSGVYYNTGRAFAHQPAPLGFDISSATETTPGLDAPGNVGEHNGLMTSKDIDGDGRADFYGNLDSSGVPKVAWHAGLGFTANYDMSSFPERVRESIYVEDDRWETRDTSLDFDGDGMADYISYDTYGWKLYKRTTDGSKPAVMKSVDNGRGLAVSVEYAPFTARADLDNNPGVTWGDSPRPGWVATSLTLIDQHSPVSVPETTKYSYKYPEWNEDQWDRWGFRGFASTWTTGPSGSITKTLYDYDTDWSGRESIRYTYANKGDHDADRPTSVHRTNYKRYKLFEGAVLSHDVPEIESFQVYTTRSQTCRAGQTSHECLGDSHMYKEVNNWSAYESPDQIQVAYLLINKSMLDDNHSDENDWRDTRKYNLYYSGDTYRIRPYIEQRVVWNPESGWANKVARRTSHFYDPEGKVELTTMVYGDTATKARTVRTYDMSTGNVLTVQKPEQHEAGGPVTSYQYDQHKLFVTKTTNELGHTVHTEHDVATGAVTSKLGPNGCDANGCSVSAEGSRYDIDALGRVTRVRTNVADGQGNYGFQAVATTTYDDFASPQQVTSKALIDFGRSAWTESTKSFDGHGRPIREVVKTEANMPDAVTTWIYDHRSHLVGFKAPDPSDDASTVYYEYDYDSLGRPISLIRPAPHPGGFASGMVIEYDELTRMRHECVVLATNGPCEYDVDPDDLPKTTPLASSQLVYDVHGRLIEVAEKIKDGEDWAITRYQYHPRGELEEIIDAKGNVTVMEHDWRSKRTAITRAGRTWKYKYDRNGNMTHRTEPVDDPALEGLYQISIVYDDLDRVTSHTAALRTIGAAPHATKLVATTYDTASYGIGRVATQTVHGYGGALLTDTFYYDVRGNTQSQLRRVDLSSLGLPIYDNRVSGQSYNALGQVKDQRFADHDFSVGLAGTRVEHTYDERGLPQAVIWGGKYLLGVGRNVSGAVTVGASSYLGAGGYPGGSPDPTGYHGVNYSYDRLGRITQYTGSYRGTPKVDQTYIYGATDEVAQVTTSLGSLAPRTMTLTYDARHQITSATDDLADDSRDYFGDFYFDVAGRFERATVTVGDGVKDAHPRDVIYRYDIDGPEHDDEFVTALENVDGAGNPLGTARAVYLPDAAGNVVKRGENCVESNPFASSFEFPNGCEQTWSFEYDGNMRQAVATMPNGAQEIYLYDGAGNRALAISKLPGGSFEKARLWFGANEIWYDAAGDVSKTWAHVGFAGQTVRIENRGKTEFQHQSALGHMLASVGADGDVEGGFSYGPFGEVLDELGDGGEHSRRFNGKEADAATGLSYYGYRYYDPLSVTWTQADPLFRFVPDLAGDAPRARNLYVYTAHNPLRLIDPDGRHPQQMMCLPSEGCGYPAGGMARGVQAVVQNHPEAIDVITDWTPGIANIKGAVQGGMEVYDKLSDGNITGALMAAAGMAGGAAGGPKGRVAAKGVTGAFRKLAAKLGGGGGGKRKRLKPSQLTGRQGPGEFTGSKIKRLRRRMDKSGYDESKPIEVAEVNGRNIVIDGHHRARAAGASKKVDTVPVTVTPVSPERAAELESQAAAAAQANNLPW